MSKHYHVLLVEEDQYDSPFAEFVYNQGQENEADDKYRGLVRLFEDAERSELTVNLQTCFGRYCDLPDKSTTVYRRVPSDNTFGKTYIASTTNCTCPSSAFGGGAVCKHSQRLAIGYYGTAPVANEDDYHRELVETLSSRR